jgi:hypothetical protein
MAPSVVEVNQVENVYSSSKVKSDETAENGLSSATNEVSGATSATGLTGMALVLSVFVWIDFAEVFEPFQQIFQRVRRGSCGSADRDDNIVFWEALESRSYTGIW